jgi:heme exporter protein B
MSWIKLTQLSLLLEWRNKSALFNSLLYSVASTYIASVLLTNQAGVQVWNGLLWLLLLFNALTACSSSFKSETGNRYLYYLQWIHPSDLIISKLVYNGIYCLLVSWIQWVLLFFFLGWPGGLIGWHLLCISLGAIGLSTVLTLTAGIAARSGNNMSLMAVLSFPLLIPTALLGVKASILIGVEAEVESFRPFLTGNAGMTILSAATGYLLFPYLWRD